MDTVPLSAWQIIQDTDGLTVLVVGLRQGVAPQDVAARLHRELDRIRVAPRVVTVREVERIPRTAIGKAPLIRILRSPTH